MTATALTGDDMTLADVWAVAVERRGDASLADTARLDATAGAKSPVYVVDRAAWIDVNVDSMAALLNPVVDALTAKRKAGPRARAKHPRWVMPWATACADSEV